DIGHARAVQGRDVMRVQRAAAVPRDFLVIRFSQMAKSSNFIATSIFQEEDQQHANETHCDLRWPQRRVLSPATRIVGIRSRCARRLGYRSRWDSVSR